MQTECPHRRFCRLDPIRDELSPQAAERFDKLALFDQLRIEGASQATALKAIGCSRATPCRWKRRLREPGVGALNTELAEFERFCNACRPHQALGQAAPMQAHNKNFDQSALAA